MTHASPSPVDTTLRAWLRLSLEPGIGPVAVRCLLEAIRDPSSFFSCPSAGWPAVLPRTLTARLEAPLQAQTAAEIDRLEHWQQAPGRLILTQADQRYPALLRHISDPPILLYAMGNIDCLNLPGFAIVGARSATRYGIDGARQFSRCLAECGWSIVSGLASGIDGAAHTGALEVPGGRTIAVMGNGLDHVYPPRHRPLGDRILAQDGLMLSEYPPWLPARPFRFPQRNRLIAGLSRGILVAEASHGSGSLITARLAGEMGRDVFALPGSIHSPLSRGCHQLIREGAILTESMADIDTVLPPPCQPSRAVPSSPRHSPPADEQSTALLSALGCETLHLDTLLQRTGLPAAPLQTALMALELAGFVACLPDGRYQATQPD
ncbi:DNA-protecting protein DprA [Alcaligenaceae bacterium SJ-26]|nr:DNA-protecting protein DprA [Alcaligenaceae bacterium SJ-26]